MIYTYGLERHSRHKQEKLMLVVVAKGSGAKDGGVYEDVGGTGCADADAEVAAGEEVRRRIALEGRSICWRFPGRP